MTWQDLIGTQIAGRYALRTILSAESQQSEFMANDSEGGEKPVAVTLVELEPGEAEPELAAITKAKQLRHPNLLQILAAGECLLQDVPVLFIVTEPVEGTLARTLGAGPLPAPMVLLEDVLAALEWLHGQGLVYRNLGPETIVRTAGRWKLADLSQLHQAGEFGPANASASRTVPPEAAKGSILPAWDLWALGVLLQDAVPAKRGARPAPFDAIVHGCLEPDPVKRLSLPDIRQMLKPTPEAIPEAYPAFKLPYDESPVSPVRALLARHAPLAIAVALVILGILAFIFLRRDRSAAPPAAVPHISHPAAAPIQPAVPSPAPAKAPPPAAAPAKRKSAAAAPQTGRADYFADNLEGHLTASGEPFSNQAMTAANRQFPLGTHLRVTNLENGRHVTVRVNDRGPHRRGFILSVTRRAAEQLGFVKAGSARVKLEVAK